jgi:hypothetical protein
MDSLDPMSLLTIYTTQYINIQNINTQDEYFTYLNAITMQTGDRYMSMLRNIIDTLPSSWQNSKLVFLKELINSIRFIMNEFLLHNNAPHTPYSYIHLLKTVNRITPQISVLNYLEHLYTLPEHTPLLEYQVYRSSVKLFLNETSRLIV